MQTMTPLRFQAGGTLRPGALYVERPADQELPAALLQGEFCYVLAPRQIGKSSLRLRTTAQLEKEGVRCAAIDLNWIGKGDEAEWYRGLLGEVSDKLELNVDVAAFWDRREGLTPAYRWSRFLAEEALTSVPGRIVIFVDEIDTVRVLPFKTDDFFATVRTVYNMQAENPEYKRLTFCLLGVAAPKDLINDPVITPFNIGRAIQLDDFSPKQAEAFLPGLSVIGGDPRRLLDAILDWTHGHPYMTQRICEALARRKSDASSTEDARVAAIVDDVFLRMEDANLEYAARHFDKKFSGPHVTQMLRLYQRLINNEQIPANKQDPSQMALRLTGMAAERQDERGLHLRVRNRIFASVFDQNWVKQNQADRLISEPLARWLASGRRDDDLLRGQALEEATEWASSRNDLSPEENEFLMRGLKVTNRKMIARRRRITAAVLVLTGFLVTTIFLAGYAFHQRDLLKGEKSQVELQKNEIEKQKQEVEVQRIKAEKQRNMAENAQALAEGQQALAEQRSKEADAARAEAQQQTAVAVEQSMAAEQANKDAQQERDRAEAEAKRAREQEKIANSERVKAEEQSRIANANAEVAKEQTRIAEKATADLEKEQNEKLRLTEQEALKREMEVVSNLLAISRQNLAKYDAIVFRDNDHLILSGGDGPTHWRIEGSKLLPSEENGPIQDKLESHFAQTLQSIKNIDGSESIVHGGGNLTLVREKDETAILKRRTGGAEVARGKTQIVLRGVEDSYEITDAAISSNGKWVALIGNDGKARIWNDKGRKREVLRPRSALLFYFPREFPWIRLQWDQKLPLTALNSVGFSKDGKYLVTGSTDRVARIYRISNRNLVAELTGHTAPIKSVSFSPDGTRVATLCADAVRIFKVDLPRRADKTSAAEVKVQGQTMSR